MGAHARRRAAMMQGRALGFHELFALHGVLDDEQRALGEHRAPAGLAGVATTERRACPYQGSRHEHALPMNLSALRQTTRHWDEVLVGLAALRGWCGGGAQPLTLAELWRLTAAAAVVPAYLLHRAAPVPVLDAGTAVLYKACLGLKFLIEQRALEALLATGACDGVAAADSLLAYAESSGWLVGREEVCAAPTGLIDEILRVARRGGAAGESRLVACLGPVPPLQEFLRASWQLWGVLVQFSGWSAWRARRVGGGVAGPDALTVADPPLQNALSLTLGMRRISVAASGLDASACGALLGAFAEIATPGAADATAAPAAASAHEPTRAEAEAEAAAAVQVAELERRLNLALGRPGDVGAARPTGLSAYRAPAGSAR